MNDPIEEAKRLFAYLNGELNEEENRKMEEQIRQDERLQELVVQLRDKVYITRELTAMRHYDTAAAKAKVKERAEFEQKWRPLREKMSQMSKEEQDKVKEGDEYKQMLEEDRQFFRTVEEVYGKAITDNKDTFWGPLLMIMQTSFLTSDQIPQYEQFSEAAKNSFYGRKVKDEILPVGGVGSTLLDFTLHKEDGTPVKFDDLIKGKKYLYIDFWASWCAPCRKEIPNVKANYEKYKDKGFEVVGISIDTNKAAWKKACEKEQLQWPSFLDRDVANLFKVRAVPTIYIVDANGKIVAMNDEIRGEKLGEKLAELFK